MRELPANILLLAFAFCLFLSAQGQVCPSSCPIGQECVVATESCITVGTCGACSSSCLEVSSCSFTGGVRRCFYKAKAEFTRCGPDYCPFEGSGTSQYDACGVDGNCDSLNEIACDGLPDPGEGNCLDRKCTGDSCGYVPDVSQCEPLLSGSNCLLPECLGDLDPNSENAATCQYTSQELCEPIDACHTVSCTLQGCQQVDNCPPNPDICKENVCVNGQCAEIPIVGCCESDADCLSPSGCTKYTCNTQTNQCESGPDLSKPECCATVNDCPTDACNTRTGCRAFTCEYSEVVCDQSDLCNQQVCDPTQGCVVPAPKQCPADTVCTTYTCNPNTGNCDSFEQPGCCENVVDCIQNEPPLDQCHTYECQSNNCVAVDLPYDPDQNVCCQSPSDCDDGLACTLDLCIAGTDNIGRCQNPADSSKPNCCDDVSECNTVTCEVASCVANECTYDRIDPQVCCLNDDNCDDGDFCTNNFCNLSDNTCFETAVECDDGNVCTSETCNSSSGCVFATVPCRECTKSYCYWSDPANHQACDKNLLAQYPTTFCGKDETTLFQEHIIANDARALLQRTYFVALNNMACRNNAYSKNHKAYMDRAVELLSSTCDPVLPGNARNCTYGTDPDCVAPYGQFVSTIAHINSYIVRHYCPGERKLVCDNLLKSGDTPHYDRYFTALAAAMEEAGYVYDQRTGMYVPAHGAVADKGNGGKVFGIVVGAVGAMAVVGVLGFFGYRYRNGLRLRKRGEVI